MAKCTKCGQEVVLAKVCPYCGAHVETLGEETEENKENERNERARGHYVGPMDDDNGRGDDRPRNPIAWLRTLISYIRDDRVSIIRKLPVAGMLIYIIWPIDFLTDIAPIIGWVDDAAVVALLWRYVSDELATYYREQRRLGRR